MPLDKYIIVRITVDEDDYITLTTVKPPVDGIMKAKYELRLVARTETSLRPSMGEDSFNDFFNEDKTSWGPIPRDKRKTRYIIIKLDYGFYSKVLR